MSVLKYLQESLNERESDVKFLELSQRVFGKMVDDISKSRYDDWYQKDIPLLHSNDGGGFYGLVSVEDLDVDGLPDDFKNFWMYIGSKKDDDDYSGTDAQATFSTNRFGIPTIKIYVGEKVLQYLKDQDVDDNTKKRILLSQHRSVFAHEFAHLLDQFVTGGKHTDKYQKRTSKDAKDYYNSTHEINAFFRGYLNAIDDEYVMDTPFDTFKREFWDEVGDAKEEFTKDTIKKMNSRLYTSWDKLREKYRKQWDSEMDEV